MDNKEKIEAIMLKLDFIRCVYDAVDLSPDERASFIFHLEGIKDDIKSLKD